MSPVELWINTDRSDSFANIAHFVDAVRRISNVPDDQVEMAFHHKNPDHEVAVHAVNPEGDWNHKAIAVDNETVVVFRKEALTPEDGSAAWHYAYDEKEIVLTKRKRLNHPSCVLDDGRVMIKGVGYFPKSHFRAIRTLD